MIRMNPDFIAKPADPTEIEARIAELRAEHLPPALFRDPAETARAAHAYAAECERRQRRAELDAGRLGHPFTLIPPRPFPYLEFAATTTRPTTTAPREPRPMTAAAATEPPPPPPTSPHQLTDRQRAALEAAARIVRSDGSVSMDGIANEVGTNWYGARDLVESLRAIGQWPYAPSHKGPPRKNPSTGEPKPKPAPRPIVVQMPAPTPTAPPKPAPVPTTPREPVSPPDSTTDAPERVLGHPGGLSANVAPSPDPLVLGLLKGTLSAALSNLGPHLSDRNRLALEMCLEVLR
jgi:hypothetical protein